MHSPPIFHSRFHQNQNFFRNLNTHIGKKEAQGSYRLLLRPLNYRTPLGSRDQGHVILQPWSGGAKCLWHTGKRTHTPTVFSKGVLLEPVSAPGSSVLQGRSRQRSKHRVTFSAAVRKKSLPLCFLYQGWRKNTQSQCTRGLAMSSKKETENVYGEWKWMIIVSLSTLISWWFHQVPGCHKHWEGKETLS